MALDAREKRGPYAVYTDEDRARGLAAMDATGGRAKLAAAATGIPESTLEQWSKSARVRSVSARKPELRAKVEAQLEKGFENTIRRYLGHLQEMPLERTGAKDAAIVAGIAHTHLRLLRSQPTSISETRDLASFLAAAYGERPAVVDVAARETPRSGSDSTER